MNPRRPVAPGPPGSSAELVLSRFFSNLLGRHLEINLSNRDVYMQRSCDEMRSRSDFGTMKLP